jgi:hypothetical protein
VTTPGFLEKHSSDNFHQLIDIQAAATAIQRHHPPVAMTEV